MIRIDQREKAIEAAVVEYYNSHHDHNPRKMVRAVIEAFERVMASTTTQPCACALAAIERGYLVLDPICQATYCKDMQRTDP
jgi:hypothetical protein